MCVYHSRACLSSCVNQTSTSLSTIKLAATHLIAAGYIDGKAVYFRHNVQFGLVLVIFNEGTYLTFKLIFHKALNLF